jgi:hypothetical protein
MISCIASISNVRYNTAKHQALVVPGAPNHYRWRSNVMTEEENTKKCSRCKEVKDRSEFNKCKSNKDGLQYCCSSCRKEYRDANKFKISAKNKAYFESHKETVLIKNKVRYESNKEDCLSKQKIYRDAHKNYISEWHKAYRAANPDKVAKRKKAYREANPEKVAAQLKNWRLANPEKCNAYGAKRYSSKCNAIPAWFEKEAVDTVYAEAISRSESEGIPYHVDHIVPVQSKLVCGLHCLANLQLLTKVQNSSKGNRHWPGKEWIINDEEGYHD